MFPDASLGTVLASWTPGGGGGQEHGIHLVYSHPLQDLLDQMASPPPSQAAL